MADFINVGGIIMDILFLKSDSTLEISAKDKPLLRSFIYKFMNDEVWS